MTTTRPDGGHNPGPAPVTRPDAEPATVPPAPSRKKIATAYPPLIAALRECLGLDMNMTRRVVIDIESGKAPVIYVELLTDKTVINVIEALSSVEIERK
jgi:hypothetical protein